MHGFPSTSHDEQQSQAQDTPRHGRQAPSDLTTAEWFCRNVCERAEAAARAAGIKDGVLVLSSFGELPVAGGHGDWEKIAPCNKSFALGQHQAMAE